MAGRRLPPGLCRVARSVAVATRVRKRVVCGYHAVSKLPPAAAASHRGRTSGADASSAGGDWWYGGGGANMAGAVAGGKKDAGGRRVMVVADGRAGASGALQWALSQAVRCNDAVLLLAVVKPPASAGGGVAIGDYSCMNLSRTSCYQQLDAMRSMCESDRPEVEVGVCVVEAEAEERAAAVVEAARRHGASLLVLGQRRRRAVARWLLALWPAGAAAAREWPRRRKGRGGMVEYCIEHAPCVALGVRRRSSGGYLVSSKRHKDFWLLA